MRNQWVTGAAGLPVLLCAALGAACASTPPVDELPSAENYYRRGLEVLEGQRVLWVFRDVDYGQAIELFQEVIDNYPYSEYATLAELKIADVYFDREQHEQAASYYQDFVELHPKHPEVPYAIYRHGMCSFEQIRDPDRDQEATRNAIAQFGVLAERYPDSEYAGLARANLAEATDRLAAHEILVGDFYFQRRECHAAARRYRSALTNYPGIDGRPRTLHRLASALRCARQDEEAITMLGRALAEEPDGDLRERIEEDLRELGASYPGSP
jgi:outer membrane protein assembly factor BamD